MENQKIIIVSNGRITEVMVDGKIYDGVAAVKFMHRGGELVDFEMTGKPIPMVDNIPSNRMGFMKKIEEFSKEQEVDEKAKEAEKLKVLCQPIVEWLEKNYDPYTQVQITSDNIELVQKTVGIPLKMADDVEINRPMH